MEGTDEGTCIVKPGEDWTMLNSEGGTYGELRLSQAHIHVLLRQQARTPGLEGAASRVLGEMTRRRRRSEEEKEREEGQVSVRTFPIVKRGDTLV